MSRRFYSADQAIGRARKLLPRDRRGAASGADGANELGSLTIFQARPSPSTASSVGLEAISRRRSSVSVSVSLYLQFGAKRLPGRVE